MRHVLPILFFGICIVACRAQSTLPAKASYRMLEAYPDDVQARLESRDQLLHGLRPPDGLSPYYVIRRLNIWPTGSDGCVITVAFMGGNDDLRQKIIDCAAEWSKYGNVRFDPIDPATKKIREWTESDTQYHADLRISFNRVDCWSLVGRAAVNSTVCPANKPSMNFEGFDIDLPDDWNAIVLHEFGHALGFEHEHQSPLGGCDNEFLWNPELGYILTRGPDLSIVPDSAGRRPGVYLALGGPPNNWPKWKVDFNLRQFKDSSAFDKSVYDNKSIMTYPLDDWMFVTKTASHCFSPENKSISPLDQQGCAKSYPRKSLNIDQMLKERSTLLGEFVATPSLDKAIQRDLRVDQQKLREIMKARNMEP